MASREYHDGGLLSAVVGSMMASIAMGGRREERVGDGREKRRRREREGGQEK